MSNPNRPIVLTMKPGRYAWCSCGKSTKEPFCDGSHEQVGMQPRFVTIEKESQVAWCGCKVSENKPYCDGTHKKYNE